ncbi:MAG: NUDIX domain-containing protein, partial [Bacteroidota bacterium]|nr:NUDIX domain-containing protein [Bacteroidota bacterium]
MEKRFNIRVYGILLKEDAILLSDERYQGRRMTKFCGGGLEWGEGLEDALRREFMEEWNLEIEVESLLFTNGFFQASAFNPNDQLISVYYKVRAQDPEMLHSIVAEGEGKEERIYWVKKEELSPEIMTFPVDQELIRHLLSSALLSE